MKPFVLLALLLPISLLFWIITYFLNIFKSDVEPISPLRFFFAILASATVAQWGLARKSLDKSGAFTGFLVGFVLTVSNLCFFTALLTFFVAGSKVTKFRNQEKRKIEADFKEGGQRNWVQVLCNGGIAAQFAIIYLIEAGSSEKLVDFTLYYNASWLSMAVLGSLCCSCGDTFASEIGAVVGKSSSARLITNFQKVPKGTNGAISLVGTIASVLGGLIVGSAYYLTLLLLANENYLISSPPQWPLIVIGGILGLTGSIIDSILGATVQYSGFDRKRRCIVEHPGPNVDHISGTEILDNHSVNLVSSLLTAVLAPYLSISVWTAVT